MKLETHLQQSNLIYMIRDDEDVYIRENQHYRFLCFGDVVQSIMLKRRPANLTLPHQYFMTLPLLFIKPENVIELGLGGGNILRFTNQVLPNCQLTSVESNLQVIQCFKQYFNPQQLDFTINCQDVHYWLSQQQSMQTDWLIFDIYHHSQNDVSSLQLINQLLAQLPNNCWLSINLVDLTETQLNKALNYLTRIKNTRKMRYFIVPQYRNIIVHLHPQFDKSQCAISTLKSYQIKRYQQLWQQGKG